MLWLHKLYKNFNDTSVNNIATSKNRIYFNKDVVLNTFISITVV